MKVCVSCMDEEEEVVFECKGGGGVCTSASSSFCAMCKTPSALDMIAAVCGKGAIMAIEQKLRGKVEFKLREENMRKEVSRTTAVDFTEKARRLFNDLADKINLQCPRCQVAFHDYDGCNALTCGVPTCRAAFCAICLKDCGSDAHQHVQEAHGDYFDKDAFKRSTLIRAQTQIAILKEQFSNEPFELKQLVLNHIEKAKLTEDSSGSTNSSTKLSAFYEKTKESLLRATRTDRLALLSSPEEYNGRRHISRDDISPRCSVPSEYRLLLKSTLTPDVYRVRLRYRNVEGVGGYYPVETAGYYTIDDIEKHFKEFPKVESLLNVTAALRCAVIAFEGSAKLFQTSSMPSMNLPKGTKLCEDEVFIKLRAIDSVGRVLDLDPEEYLPDRLIVLGINQNKRMLLLERHVENTPKSELMIQPLQHLIGVGRPMAVITEINMAIPESQVDLNEEQKKVAHPLCLKTAMEVAGPPGTGKTKTIVELVRALLQCTCFDILLLSERNGAINAVAEKFRDASLRVSEKYFKITDLNVWTSVMTYGSGENMGESTKLFTLEEKLCFHPELVDLQEKLELLGAASESLAKTLRAKLAVLVLSFGDHFGEPLAVNLSQQIEKNRVELATPLSIISAVESVAKDIQYLLKKGEETSAKYADEALASDVIAHHSALLARLIPVLTPRDKQPWDAKEATRRLRYLLVRFHIVLGLVMFSADNATDLYQETTKVDKEYEALKARLKNELPTLARLHMSTIGSSHRLPGDKNNMDGDLVNAFNQMVLDDSDYEDETTIPKETVVMFDEAGCIPAFELFGLTRLGRTIKALVMVGDKHQLPPYDPSAGRPFHRNSSFGTLGSRNGGVPDRIRSLLDSSVLDADSGKIILTKQYRVPRDIAEMLNHRVYRGQYNTCPRANVPLSGLRMINVEWSESPRRKYVNPNEVQKGLDLLNELSLDSEIRSTLVITPYKNQQREFEFQIDRLKQRKQEIVTTVLTIDQCQGQEADAVILSLVRKPTRFLNINRLNVALSRFRRRLYVLTDFNDLHQACRDKDWDCARLAADLLTGTL